MFKKLFHPKTIIFILLAICFLLLMPKIKGLLLVLFASFVCAAALNPIVNRLEDKFKNRFVSASVIVIGTITVLSALFLPIFIMCYKEILLFISIMPQKAVNLYNFLSNTKFYGKNIAQLIPLDNFAGFTSDLAQDIFNQSLNITLASAKTLFILLALTMFVFYILLDEKYLRAKFIEFFPPALKDKTGIILSNITYKVGNYVRAQIISMVLVGVMITVMVACLGIDYPILLGLVAGICEIVPVLGPTLALSVIVAIAIPLGITKVILAFVLFLLIQQISNYVIRPLLFGKFMKLHPITVLVAIFVAEQFLGIFGVILSPAIAATLCVLIDELYLNPMNEQDFGKEVG